MATTMLNLCRGGLQEVGEVERLKAVLVKDKIAYHESVGDVGPSMSIPSLSTNNPSPSMSWDDIGPPQTYIDITDPTSSWIIWGDY
jgi:hypothetical protein